MTNQSRTGTIYIHWEDEDSVQRKSPDHVQGVPNPFVGRGAFETIEQERSHESPSHFIMFITRSMMISLRYYIDRSPLP